MNFEVLFISLIEKPFKLSFLQSFNQLLLFVPDFWLIVVHPLAYVKYHSFVTMFPSHSGELSASQWNLKLLSVMQPLAFLCA